MEAVDRGNKMRRCFAWSRGRGPSSAGQHHSGYWISDSLEGRMRVRRKNVISLWCVNSYGHFPFNPSLPDEKLVRYLTTRERNKDFSLKNSSGPRNPGLLLGVFIAHAENEDESTMLELGSRCCRVAVAPPQSIKPMLT